MPTVPAVLSGTSSHLRGTPATPAGRAIPLRRTARGTQRHVPRILLPAAGAEVRVSDPACSGAAGRLLRRALRDAAASADPFSAGAAVHRVAGAGGHPQVVTPLLAAFVDDAVRAAALTGGACDPTVGAALVVHRAAARDATSRRREAFPGCALLDAPTPRPAAGAGHVRLSGRRLQVPAGTVLDLGATSAAGAATATARLVADRLHTGAMVRIGSAVATAGPSPAGGWHVTLPDGLALALPGGQSCGSLQDAARHVVDPATGALVADVWACVSVLAGDAVTAKAVAVEVAVAGADGVDVLVRHLAAGRVLGARLTRRGAADVVLGDLHPAAR